MKKLNSAIFAITFFISACSPRMPGPAGEVTPADNLENTGSQPAVAQTPNPIINPVLEITGEEQLVFDWDGDRCADVNIPDLAFRAFKDENDQVQAIISSDISYRMVGPDLNNLAMDCDPIMTSKNNPDPSQYTDKQWVAATYTEDGQTIYALVHNEYQGHVHPGQCPQDDYFACWDNSITLAVSTDGGESFTEAYAPPSHLIARFPYPYKAGAGPEGFRAPSNIIRAKDGYLYNFFNVSEYETQNQWVCIMRTDDISRPDSWRFWDGVGFNGQFADPYIDTIENPLDHICAPLDQENIGHALNESITYNTYLDKYVLIGISADWLDEREVWGFYYAFSNDLVHWTKRKLLMEIDLPWTVEFPGSDLSYLYPSLIDPDSDSRNFDTTGKTAYLYYTRNNFGHASLDRDLIRIPVEFFLE